MREASDQDRRTLLAVRLAISEARERSRPASSYLDRVVISLLVGFAVETALGVGLGRELGRGGFESELNALEAEVGRLAFRKEASKVWRARTSVQHSGLPPSREEARQLAVAASQFSRELSQRVFDLDLETISQSDTIRSPQVRAAVAQAEAAASAGNYLVAAQWAARAAARLKRGIEDHLRGTTDPLRWTATEAFFEGIGGAQDMVRELDSAFAQVRLERILGSEVETWRALERVLPVAVKVQGRDEEVIHQRIDYAPDPDEVQWALARLIDLALGMESWPRS